MALNHIVNGSPVEVKHLSVQEGTSTAQPVNYLIKGNKLVFADSNLYLKGPVNYTVVGSPTIVDGVASGFTSSSCLYTTASPSFSSSCEFVCEFTTGTGISTDQGIITTYGSGDSFNPFYIYNGNLVGWISSNNTSWGKEEIITSITANTKYRFKATYANNEYNWYQYDFNTNSYGNSIKTISFGAFYSGNRFAIGSNRGSNSPFPGSINLKETYIVLDGALWFYGKNYASQNIAPVPSGYTYGATTTPSIGWVDMRTQQFTAAPSGATLGKDE